ncbi:unnamed protein product [Allacma fusca]|uniref:Uncharacterized protein n=1 Tax=Allacma fusca TaxID=39272 RepID=A0A8J2LH56_9HEXA|nr:unnamed protein product [Allacma fusca]
MRVARTEDIPSIIRRPYEESAKESTMVNSFAKTGIFLSSIGASNRHVFTDDDFTAESSGNVETPEPSDNEDEDDNGGNDIPNPEEIAIAEDFNISNDIYEDTPEDMRSNSNRSEPSIDVQFRESVALPDNVRDNEPAGPSNAVSLTTSVSRSIITFSNPQNPQPKVSKTILKIPTWNLVDYTDSSEEEDSEDNIVDVTNSSNENIILGITKLLVAAKTLKQLL